MDSSPYASIALRDPALLFEEMLAALGRRGRCLGVRLCVADLAPGVRRRRAAPCDRARLAPRAADALARQPRHARVPRPRVRARARRLMPRHGVPDRSHTRARRTPSPLGARDADRRLRREVARLRHAARGACAHSPSRSARRARRTPACCPTRRCSRSCATRTAATAARWPIWPTRRAACANTAINDREIERLMALARRHALVD